MRLEDLSVGEEHLPDSKQREMVFIVPTRGRPRQVEKLCEAWEKTCVTNPTLLLCVDDDDPCLQEYIDLVNGGNNIFEPLVYEHFLLEIRIGKRLRLGPTLNESALEWVDRSKNIGFMGDDHRPRSRGWDLEYITELELMDCGMVYGNDLLQGEKLPTQIAMSSDIIKAMGFMVPPGLIHMYLDDFWLYLGTSLDSIVYQPDVIIEHMHPLAGKSAWDAGYREVNADSMYAHDKIAYREFRETGGFEKARQAIIQFVIAKNESDESIQSDIPDVEEDATLDGML
jgi:hypothetical protein